MREKDFPAQHPQEEEEARVPAAYAQPRRARGAEAPTPQGPRAPIGLTRRVKMGAELRSMSGGRRLQSVALTLLSGATATQGPPRIAFAVPRSVGGSVIRNKVRRRLRAALRFHSGLLTPGSVYLIGARSGATSATYREIEATLGELLERSAEGRG